MTADDIMVMNVMDVAHRAGVCAGEEVHIACAKIARWVALQIAMGEDDSSLPDLPR